MKVKITESYQRLKLAFDGRVYSAEVFGSGHGCAVEIIELYKATGSTIGERRRYRVPDRLKWSVVIKRFLDDTGKTLPAIVTGTRRITP